MTFEPKQRVKWTDGSGFNTSERRGHVTRATASTVWVQPDHGQDGDFMQFRKGRYGFSLTLLTDHELKTEVWLAAKPPTQTITVTFGLGRDIRQDLARVQLRSQVERNTVTHAILDQITIEATILAQWLRSRP